jgi:hypothetical protein
MKRLDVSPLPCMEVPEETRGHGATDEGFVEDAVILHLLTAAGPYRDRHHEPANAPAADAFDYAGWPLPVWQARAV